MTIKVLNLYAGIGGNRKLWPNEQIDVTAVELNPLIADYYKKQHPQDIVIVADAHEYLLKHSHEYDIIWSSPVCVTHSKARFWASKGGKYQVVYPDMALYQEILFLQYYYNGLWVVENVDGFYKPLINPSCKIGGHYFWANFDIELKQFDRPYVPTTKGSDINFGYNLNGINFGKRKDQIVRNTINPELGLHIFNCAFKVKQKSLLEVTP